MNPYIYPQSEILSTLRVLLSEPTAERWTDVQIYSCMSIALQGWQGRVRVPYIYTISGGWVDGTYEYTLPDYVDTKTIQPQVKVSVDEWPELTEETWADVLNYSVEPNTTGGSTLRIHYSMPGRDIYGATNEGRVIWWGQPGQIPSTIPTLDSNITAAATSLTLTSKPTIGRVGYVRIGTEWIQYAGFTESTSTLTLTNLLRGLYGTTAASHTAGDSVAWGVGMENPSLLNALYDGARIYLMQIYLSNSSSRETAQYEKQLVLYQDMLEKFWRGYVSSRPVRMRLSREAIGDI